MYFSFIRGVAIFKIFITVYSLYRIIIFWDSRMKRKLKETNRIINNEIIFFMDNLQVKYFIPHRVKIFLYCLGAFLHFTNLNCYVRITRSYKLTNVKQHRIMVKFIVVFFILLFIYQLSIYECLPGIASERVLPSFRNTYKGAL